MLANVEFMVPLLSLQEAPGVTVFHKVDDEFKVPKTAFYFEFARYMVQ